MEVLEKFFNQKKTLLNELLESEILDCEELNNTFKNLSQIPFQNIRNVINFLINFSADFSEKTQLIAGKIEFDENYKELENVINELSIYFEDKYYDQIYRKTQNIFKNFGIHHVLIDILKVLLFIFPYYIIFVIFIFS